MYKQDLNKGYADQNPLPYHNFIGTWKKHCWHVKVRNTTRFTKCFLCERLRHSITKAARDGTPFGEIKFQKASHYDFVFRELSDYMPKRELADIKRAEYMSIVIHGAEQKAFTLPHFYVSDKNQRTRTEGSNDWPSLSRNDQPTKPLCTRLTLTM